MGWTKRDYLRQAFEEIGLASYIYDLTPEQLWSALRRLDSMMASFNANGVCVGWQMSTEPNMSDIDFQTRVPDAANEAIYLNLAVRLASSYGRVVSPELKTLADSCYSTLLNWTIRPIPQRHYPNTLPLGAGAKPWRNYLNPFVRQEPAPLLDNSDNKIILE